MQMIGESAYDNLLESMEGDDFEDRWNLLGEPWSNHRGWNQ